MVHTLIIFEVQFAIVKFIGINARNVEWNYSSFFQNNIDVIKYVKLKNKCNNTLNFHYCYEFIKNNNGNLSQERQYIELKKPFFITTT